MKQMIYTYFCKCYISIIISIFIISQICPIIAKDNGRLTDGSQPISRLDTQIKLNSVCTKCLKKFCENRLEALPASSRYCCKSHVQASVDKEVECSRFDALGASVVETCHIHKSDWNICVNIVMGDLCSGCKTWIEPTSNIWYPAYCSHQVRTGVIGDPTSTVNKIVIPNTADSLQCLLGTCTDTSNNIISGATVDTCTGDNTWTPISPGGCYDSTNVKILAECFDESGKKKNSVTTRNTCLAVGSCSNTAHSTIETCINNCSITDHATEEACIAAEGTWNIEIWTSQSTWRDADNENNCLSGSCFFKDMKGNDHPLNVGLHNEKGCYEVSSTNTWVGTTHTWVPYRKWTPAECRTAESTVVVSANSKLTCQGKDLDALIPKITNHGVIIRPPPDQRKVGSEVIIDPDPHICLQDPHCVCVHYNLILTLMFSFQCFVPNLCLVRKSKGFFFFFETFISYIVFIFVIEG